jgi:hypothetical protein
MFQLLKYVNVFSNVHTSPNENITESKLLNLAVSMSLVSMCMTILSASLVNINLQYVQKFTKADGMHFGMHY